MTDQDIFERDDGKCRICGLDLRSLAERCERLGGWSYPPLREVLKRFGFNDGQRLWQVDHIEPRYYDGPDTPENKRTLCVPCHKDETALLAGQRKRTRKWRDWKDETLPPRVLRRLPGND